MRLLCACMGVSFFCAASMASPPETGAGAAAPQALLKVGDPAPPISIQDWVTNSPVDLAAGKDKECYAIWFWQPGDLGSTQLTPRMTILHHRYADRGLKVVGVVTESETNTLEAVRKFVTDMGPKVGWTVAYDKAKETWMAWVVASLKPGDGPSLPKVFLVDRKGIIVWIGTPADPDFEDIIIDVVDDTHSIATWEKVVELWGVMGTFMNRREFDKAQAQLDEVLRVYPASSKAINAKVFVYTQQMRDWEALHTWAQNYLAAYAKDAHTMHRLAVALSRPAVQGELAQRDPVTACRAARIAYEAGKNTGLLGDVAPLYARSLKDLGAVKQAVDVLTDACNRIQGFERDQLTAELEYYKRCMAGQAELELPIAAILSKLTEAKPAEAKSVDAAPSPPAKPDGDGKGGEK
ncbi:MAG: redoxin family protein [Phycisphaerales bacterium]|nr:redoxin family protein [Phycisphaerales bacterium]